MTDPVAQRYSRLATDFAERIGSVPADRWASPSPCEGWTALDVVRHVVETHGMFLGFIGRSLPGDMPTVDEDPGGAFHAARRSVQACLDDAELANIEYNGAFGTTTFARGVDGFLSFDLNVHGWDLAQATGLADRIDPAEVSRLRREAEAFGEAMRGPGAFGPAVEPPQGADEQARLLAFLGRHPA